MVQTIWRLSMLVAVLVASSCGRPPAPVSLEPDLLDTTSTMRDIMDSMVDPSADYLFESVATISDERGITERAPQTDEEWQEVRRRAIQLIEAPNLLVMPGRRVARPTDRADNPEFELEPEQIEQRIAADRALFVTHARNLQNAALMALKAAEAKDKGALFGASEVIDQTCETCHLQFWYPTDRTASEASGQP